MNCNGRRPDGNAPALKPPRTKPERIPAARATRAAGNFLLSRSPNTRDENDDPDDEIDVLFGESAKGDVEKHLWRDNQARIPFFAR